VEVFDPASTRGLKTEFHLSNVYKNSVRTSQETHYVFATNTKRLMLFRQIIVVYCENRKKHKYAVCAEFRIRACKTGGTTGL
jgi:hypothetical protein